MYAERDRGDETFRDILRQMRRWSLQQSSQGPVYLGYRLGHIRGDGRVFRALVYNKGAMVLHMLRRMLGDDAFFAGIRRFYGDWRFRKAGTDDFRQAMEAASGRDLAAFFEGWVYGFAVPKLRFTSRVDGSDVQIRFEHLGDVVPVPVTVTLTYTDGRSEEVVIEVAEKSVERALRLNGPLRSVDANRDHAAVAEISR
jgi:aminopeptidase N